MHWDAVPGSRLLRSYRLEWLRGDLVAGLVLAAYLLPAGLGDASLAGLPPEAGLYACLFAGLVFWLFCSSRHTAITVTSAISLLVGTSLGDLAGGDAARYAALASATALLVAALGFVAWLLRAGSLVSFISETVMTGFKTGVALHLAIGLVARSRRGKKVTVEARLLGATLGEGWDVMGDLLAALRPGLILVDGEEELSSLAAERFAGVPVQRCLWHLSRGVYRAARHTDRVSHDLADDFRRQLATLLTNAYRDHDLDAAQGAYADLIEDAEACGARAAAAHLRGASEEVFTFLTHPGAGRLLFGDKGRPELGTGVLERVMREMNRRTDIGVRWSIAGVRAVLMVKLQRKYAHGPWSPNPVPDQQPPAARFSLAA